MKSPVRKSVASLVIWQVHSAENASAAALDELAVSRDKNAKLTQSILVAEAATKQLQVDSRAQREIQASLQAGMETRVLAASSAARKRIASQHWAVVMGAREAATVRQAVAMWAQEAQLHRAILRVRRAAGSMVKAQQAVAARNSGIVQLEWVLRLAGQRQMPGKLRTVVAIWVDNTKIAYMDKGNAPSKALAMGRATMLIDALAKVETDDESSQHTPWG